MPSLIEVFRRLSRPAQPLPTSVAPRLLPLPGLRVVLWDIYGTLLISASGEVGTLAENSRAAAAQEALSQLDLRPTAAPARSPGSAAEAAGPLMADLLTEAIQAHHRRARAEGIEHPEVNILEVWNDVLEALVVRGVLDIRPDEVDLPRLAIEYEARVNPAWAMPGAEDCLQRLRSHGTTLGLISNAQFYTIPLLEALLGKSLEELGFDPQLRYYSYERRHAKPDPQMFAEARQALASRGIEPAEVLYVGNDMRNDIGPARATGFRTALFAGDARSLRLRREDPALSGMEADLVLTHLNQLPEMAGA